MIKLQQISDKTAITISMVCVIHCIGQPFLLIIIPSLSGFVFLEHDAFHQLVLYAVVPVGLLALTIGYFHHRRFHIFALGASGLLLLGSISYFDHDTLGELGEIILTEIASGIIIYAHILNYKVRHPSLFKSKKEES